MEPGILDDDLTDETLASSIGGKLSFSEEAKSASIPRDLSSGTLEASIGKSAFTCPGPAGVGFQVVSSRLVMEPHHKHVLYSIAILRSSSAPDEPHTTIERRYSDFERLNTMLRKHSPSIMKTISFPRKKVTGNFKAETIAERSRAFEQFLAHVFSVDALRNLSLFTDFFYGRDLHLAYQKLVNGAYAEAIDLFNASLSIQRKLHGDFSRCVLATLCALTASSYVLERYDNAFVFSESALKCLDGCDGGKYSVPLLELSIRLCWQLGKEKTDLESKLQHLQQRAGPASSSLLQVVVSDCM